MVDGGPCGHGMPEISSNIIEPLRTAVMARLQATAEFGVPPALKIISTADGDASKRVQQALGAAGGAGAVVLVAQPRVAARNQHLQTLSVIIDIEENGELNRGVGGQRRTAAAIAELIVKRLREWTPALPMGPLSLTTWEKPPEAGQQVHTLTFSAGLMLG